MKMLNTHLVFRSNTGKSGSSIWDEAVRGLRYK